MRKLEIIYKIFEQSNYFGIEIDITSMKKMIERFKELSVSQLCDCLEYIETNRTVADFKHAILVFTGIKLK